MFVLYTKNHALQRVTVPRNGKAVFTRGGDQGSPIPPGPYEEYTVMTETSGAEVGYRFGGYGDILPDSDFQGENIFRLFTIDQAAPFNNALSLAFSGRNKPQTLFNKLQIVGFSDPGWGGGGVVLEAAREYIADLANNTYWIWDQPESFVNLHLYTLRLFYDE